MRTSRNPVFNKVNNLSQDADTNVRAGEGGQVLIENATYTGVGLKILYFLVISIVSAFAGLFLFSIYPELFVVILIASLFTGFISAILAMSQFKLSLVFGTLYCIGEGMFLGLLSAIAEAAMPGILISVVAATLSVVLVSGLLFVTKLIKVTSKFYRFLMTMGIGFIITVLLINILSWVGLIDGSNIANWVEVCKVLTNLVPNVFINRLSVPIRLEILLSHIDAQCS